MRDVYLSGTAVNQLKRATAVTNRSMRDNGLPLVSVTYNLPETRIRFDIGVTVSAHPVTLPRVIFDDGYTSRPLPADPVAEYAETVESIIATDRLIVVGLDAMTVVRCAAAHAALTARDQSAMPPRTGDVIAAIIGQDPGIVQLPDDIGHVVYSVDDYRTVPEYHEVGRGLAGRVMVRSISSTISVPLAHDVASRVFAAFG